jgi:Rrf2 family nitric oxide-sensitive transcriptional repressor
VILFAFCGLPCVKKDSMFSQTVEYALRAVVHLATRSPYPQTTADIAAATQVPAPYLSKVLQGLREKGIVNLQRGVKGGVSLAQSPEKLTIYDIVNAVEPIQRITQCPLDLKAHGTRLCALHSRMDQALQATEDAFRGTTLAELLRDSNPSIPLCEHGDRSSVDSAEIDPGNSDLKRS